MKLSFRLRSLWTVFSVYIATNDIQSYLWHGQFFVCMTDTDCWISLTQNPDQLYPFYCVNQKHPQNYKVSPSVQFSSVAQSCPTLCDPMNRSTPGIPVHHQLPEFTQTHVHRVRDAIHPSHPLSSPSPPAPNPSQHQSLFQWVNFSHEVAKVLEFQL